MEFRRLGSINHIEQYSVFREQCGSFNTQGYNTFCESAFNVTTTILNTHLLFPAMKLYIPMASPCVK